MSLISLGLTVIILCAYVFVTKTKFFGLGLDKNMKWKTPIVFIIPKLSRDFM
jgi:hypothetical protein